MAKQLTNYQFRGIPMPNAYARILGANYNRGEALPFITCKVAVYFDVATREADVTNFVDCLEYVISDSDGTLFTSNLGSPATTGGTVIAEFLAALYAALTLHPEASLLFVGSVDV